MDNKQIPLLTAARFPARFLCVFLCLAIILTAVAPVRGEPTALSWEERLARARTKYNGNTINIFSKGHGRRRKGKINVCFYPEDSSDDSFVHINIYESLQITDEAEIQAILEAISESDFFQDEYGSISFMKAQWITHNMVHSLSESDTEQQKAFQELTGISVSQIVASAMELDLSPLTTLTGQEKAVYEFMELLLALDKN